MGRIVFRNKGVTLIELLVVLVLSGILVGALYQTFVGQQKTYTVQEQVVEMQQNVRVAIDKMMREIRMAGYGGNILTTFGNVNGYNSIITPVNNENNIGKNDDAITIIFADEVSKLTEAAAQGDSKLTVSDAYKKFNSDKKKYLCLNGENNYVVQGVSTTTITLASSLLEGHLKNEPVFLVKAIKYKLRWDNDDPTMPVLVRDENTGGGSQVIAENIEDLQVTVSSTLVNIKIIARTKMIDPQLSGDGYRRRTLASNIKVRNLGL